MAHDQVHESARAGAGMVATPHPQATEAGRAVLEEGGNAIEAALAAAAALGIACPHLGGLGGDGLWLIRDPAGRVTVIDAAGPAGAGADAAFYRTRDFDELPRCGALAALTVPGTVGGWMRAQEAARAHGGRMPMRRLLESALEQARTGHTVSSGQVRAAARARVELDAVLGFRTAFLASDGTVPEAGTHQPCARLADTLEHLALAGLSDFYRGDVAREMAADLERAGSPLARADFTAYAARTRPALSVKLPGLTLWAPPPPMQGLLTLLTLALFSRLGITEAEGFAPVHGLIEAARRAQAIAAPALTDSIVLSADPAELLAPEALARAAAGIDLRRAAPAPRRPAPDIGGAWIGAADRNGLVVSCVQSLHAPFGCGLVLPATGVLMNNSGAAFTLDPRAVAPLQPGRRPPVTLSAGLAVLADGRVIGLGSGGDSPALAEARILSRYLAGAPLGAALAAPRWRQTDRLLLEAGFDEQLADRLAAAGHDVEIIGVPFSDAMGCAGVVVRHPGATGLEGAHDPRGEGGADGV
ncbi:gamma-glutamyltransferase [Ancylobacter polymorphus]|uniref:Gamma-glutamyltransferase family protein n=1 Tax=Ancylobacter polymorphus TaxID=223390 RepID=A0A9E7D4T1_9HYPH|nr:gamma-glutamyltransferase [Ancylobacter polymorphus]UOK72097.1 gamma-glutamyltransferase family protein [Ancylobacter polymorphus]